MQEGLKYKQQLLSCQLLFGSFCFAWFGSSSFGSFGFCSLLDRSCLAGFSRTSQTSPLLGWFLCPSRQWCSLVFCSEYTVIFFLPSLILIRTRAASHTTTLAKQGSTLTIIFRSTCAANKKIKNLGHSKKILEHLLLNNKNVPSHYEVILDSSKWFTGAF